MGGRGWVLFLLAANLVKANKSGLTGNHAAGAISHEEGRTAVWTLYLHVS